MEYSQSQRARANEIESRVGTQEEILQMLARAEGEWIAALAKTGRTAHTKWELRYFHYLGSAQSWGSLSYLVRAAKEDHVTIANLAQREVDALRQSGDAMTEQKLQLLTNMIVSQAQAAVVASSAEFAAQIDAHKADYERLMQLNVPDYGGQRDQAISNLNENGSTTPASPSGTLVDYKTPNDGSGKDKAGWGSEGDVAAKANTDPAASRPAGQSSSPPPMPSSQSGGQMGSGSSPGSGSGGMSGAGGGQGANASKGFLSHADGPLSGGGKGFDRIAAPPAGSPSTASSSPAASGGGHSSSGSTSGAVPSARGTASFTAGTGAIPQGAAGQAQTGQTPGASGASTAGPTPAGSASPGYIASQSLSGGTATAPPASTNPMQTPPGAAAPPPPVAGSSTTTLVGGPAALAALGAGGAGWSPDPEAAAAYAEAAVRILVAQTLKSGYMGGDWAVTVLRSPDGATHAFVRSSEAGGAIPHRVRVPVGLAASRSTTSTAASPDPGGDPLAALLSDARALVSESPGTRILAAAASTPENTVEEHAATVPGARVVAVSPRGVEPQWHPEGVHRLDWAYPGYAKQVRAAAEEGRAVKMAAEVAGLAMRKTPVQGPSDEIATALTARRPIEKARWDAAASQRIGLIVEYHLQRSGAAREASAEVFRKAAAVETVWLAGEVLSRPRDAEALADVVYAARMATREQAQPKQEVAV